MKKKESYISLGDVIGIILCILLNGICVYISLVSFSGLERITLTCMFSFGLILFCYVLLIKYLTKKW